MAIAGGTVRIFDGKPSSHCSIGGVGSGGLSSNDASPTTGSSGQDVRLPIYDTRVSTLTLRLMLDMSGVPIGFHSASCVSVE